MQNICHRNRISPFLPKLAPQRILLQANNKSHAVIAKQRPAPFPEKRGSHRRRFFYCSQARIRQRLPCSQRPADQGHHRCRRYGPGPYSLSRHKGCSHLRCRQEPPHRGGQFHWRRRKNLSRSPGAHRLTRGRYCTHRYATPLAWTDRH